MSVGTFHPRSLLISILLSFFLAGCATHTYRYDNSLQTEIEQRAVTQHRADLSVSASVLSGDEAEALFGLSLDKQGIQAVWLRIVNNGTERVRFAPYSVDPNYFPPYEVAYMNRKAFRKDQLPLIEARLNASVIPRRIPANTTASGYIFTNAEPGTKSFNLDIFLVERKQQPNEHFTFFVNVPGFVPDHAEVDFASLYDAEQIRDLDTDEFRAFLALNWPCCTRNHDGSQSGRPVSVVYIADGPTLLQALLRAQWSENSSEKDDNYLNRSDYYFGRPPDTIFRKKREQGTDRDEISLWLSPVRVNGTQVWVAQVKHAIGRRFGIGDYFFGVRLDPDADEGRDFILQDFWYAQSLAAFAWSAHGQSVPQDDPKLDFNGNPWYSDGFVSVQWLSDRTLSLMDAKPIHWDARVRVGGGGE